MMNLGTKPMSDKDWKYCHSKVRSMYLNYDDVMQIRMALDYMSRKGSQFLEFGEVCNGTI